MSDSILSQIERRLIALRLPPARRKRALQELSEHREDLIRAAVGDGLSETEAGIRADHSLGDPIDLANKIILATRASSWSGRHPIAAFCLLPFFGTVLAVAAAYAVVLGIFHFWMQSPNVEGPGVMAIAILEVWFAQISFFAHVAQLAVIAALAFIFCKLAVRSVTDRRWMWAACGICSLQGYMWTIFVSANGFSVPYHFWPTAFVPLESAIIPLAVAAFIELRQRRFNVTRLS